MRVYNKGDVIKFKSEHGTTLEGTVYDSSTDAVIVSTIFGTYSIARERIISGGSVFGSSISVKDDFEYGWWDSFEDDQDAGY